MYEMTAPFINHDLNKLIQKLNNCDETPNDITGTLKDIKEEVGSL